MTEIKDRVRAYLSKSIPYSITDNEDIFERAVVDSLFAIQLVAFVEQEFAIIAEPTDLDINNFCSISALARFVERKQIKVTPDDVHEIRD